MTRPKVLNAGQCGLDHSSIQCLLDSLGAGVFAAHSIDEVLAAVQRNHFDLVLINRIFDRTGEQGLQCVRALKGQPACASIPVMLISNYPDAQEAAQQLGAVPGFGKSALWEPATKALLSSVLSRV